MKEFIQLHENDHVIVVFKDYKQGEVIEVESHGQRKRIEVLEDVGKGHKVAIRAIKQGEDVLKFGYSIGKSKEPIDVGQWVHTHNVTSGLKGIIDYSYTPIETPNPNSEVKRSFEGYIRENGDVGIRNEIWIINTVGCINKTCEMLAKMGNAQFSDRQIDGIYHFPHPYGCSQLGDDLKYTQKVLKSLAQHPNAAGILVVGLGCENNQVDEFKALFEDINPNRMKFLKTQMVDDEVEQGLQLLEELVDYAETFERAEIPLSKLKIGLKCGGSDGLSGITANPLVGEISDAVIAEGGTSILTEVPEMFGAETILMSRAKDHFIYEKIVSLINDFKDYFIEHNQEIYENPSPGNKEGGISTLEEKSLGCTQKGGHSEVVDVVPYGERVSKHGLNLLQSPGNDLVSVTALATSGAHIVLFTTGRGTPFGGPVPTLKISTNSDLAKRKKHWIDFNAGELLEGKSMSNLRDDLLEHIIQIASGSIKTKNEEFGFREIAIFKDGVTL